MRAGSGKSLVVAILAGLSRSSETGFTKVTVLYNDKDLMDFEAPTIAKLHSQSLDVNVKFIQELGTEN